MEDYNALKSNNVLEKENKLQVWLELGISANSWLSLSLWLGKNKLGYRDLNVIFSCVFTLPAPTPFHVYIEKWIAKCCVLSFLCVYLKGRLADVAPADFFRVNPCLFCLAFLWLSLNWRERLCRWMGWVWIPYINQMEKTDIQSCTPRHQPPSKACILSRTTCGAQAVKCIISLKSLQSDQSAQKIFLVYYAEL